MAFPHDGKKFQPGQSGNPNGKPKGSRHLSSVIQELMDNDDFELKLKDGKTLKGRPSKKLVEVMYGLAVSGNTKAADWLAKYGYGQKMEIEHSGEITNGENNPELAQQFSEFLKKQTKS